MTNKKSRLGSEPKFAILKRTGNKNSVDNKSNEKNLDQSPKELVSQEVSDENYSKSIPEKIEFVRITTQIDSKTDQQLELARVILKKKKQDLINELLSKGLNDLGISFPSL